MFPRRSLTGDKGQWVTEAEVHWLVSHPVIEREERLRMRGLMFIDRIIAASMYRDCPLLQRAIHTFKYKRIPALCDALGKIMITTREMQGSDTVLCPVPLHWSREFSRGFNQAQLLAEMLARDRDLLVCNLLRRTRPTGHQAHRNRDERLIAVADAFACIKNTVPKHVTLVDDLATTGATLDACAHALKIAGVKTVEAWVIAHG
ncbi:MAG: hypothetical protein O2904_01175 [bacterium]|nr:hypothetical protein [bacterium]